MKVLFTTIMMSLLVSTTCYAGIPGSTFMRIYEECYTPAIIERSDGGPFSGSLRLHLYVDGGVVIMAACSDGGRSPLGLEAGDELLSVNGKNLIDMPLKEAWLLLEMQTRQIYALEVKKMGTGARQKMTFRCLKAGNFDLQQFEKKLKEAKLPEPTTLAGR